MIAFLKLVGISAQKAYVFVVDVDVDEAAHLAAFVTQMLGDGGVLRAKVLEEPGQIGALAFDFARAISKAAQGAGIRKLSSSELEANWKFQSALWACLASKGYDVGTPVSLEAFVAAGGVVDAVSRQADFGGADQPHADADMQACVAEVG